MIAILSIISVFDVFSKKKKKIAESVEHIFLELHIQEKICPFDTIAIK